jgi:hypothetical protein
MLVGPVTMWCLRHQIYKQYFITRTLVGVCWLSNKKLVAINITSSAAVLPFGLCGN